MPACSTLLGCLLGAEPGRAPGAVQGHEGPALRLRHSMDDIAAPTRVTVANVRGTAWGQMTSHRTMQMQVRTDRGEYIMQQPCHVAADKLYVAERAEEREPSILRYARIAGRLLDLWYVLGHGSSCQ